MTLIPICGPREGGLQIPVTLQMTLSQHVSSRKSFQIHFISKKYVCVSFNKKKSLHGYIDDYGIFGKLRAVRVFG